MRTPFILALALALAGLLPEDGQAQSGHWTSAFSASPTETVPANTQLGGRTFRQMARVTASGGRLRVRLSNSENKVPLRIGAMTAGGVPVFFNGRRSALIAPGSPLFSDPINRPVTAGERIELRVYLPEADARPTLHWTGNDTAGISPPGDYSARNPFPIASTSQFRFLVAGIDVETVVPNRVIVAVGDSITDGYGATGDHDTRWPDLLANRLASAGTTRAVVNAGIGGNRLLRDGTFTGAGRALLARLNDDVFSLDGVATLIVLIGINDIGWPGSIQPHGTGLLAPASDLPDSAALIDGYCQIVERAHARGLSVIGGTLLPFAGTRERGYFTPAKERIRQDVNTQLRAGACFDALIDFDAALRDPASPERLDPRFDIGDHLHPSPAGYAAMADAIDLKLLVEGAKAAVSKSIK